MDIKTERLFLDERIIVPKILNNFIIWLEGKIIGQISICRNEEIMYEIYKEFRGNGYATEALKTVMKIAFKHKKKPVLVIHKDNIASQRVAQKAGFYIISSNREWDKWIATKKPE